MTESDERVASARTEFTPCVPPDGEPFELTWKAHPAVERPAAAVVACVVIVAIGLAVFQATASTLWPLFAVLVMCLALHAFFFATSFRIDDQGITSVSLMGRRRLKWAEVRRAEIGRAGAWLSPYGYRTWREGRRGIHVLYGRRREEVVGALRRYTEGASPRVDAEADG